MANIELHSCDWMPLDTGLDEGARICAIGDVHGLAGHLRALISKFESDAVDLESTELLLLGDLIDRGPDSLGAIDAALDSRKRNFGSELFLMGNHEQMLRRALRGTDDDIELWLYNGGRSLLRQLEREYGYFHLNSKPFADSLRESLAPRRIEFLENLQPHQFEEKLLFVHAGINPFRPLDEHLSQPWDLLSEWHWAWIRGPFLAKPVPFAGITVVHGHTIARNWRPEIVDSQLFAPHMENGGKINLDAGSFRTDCVAGAEFESDRYRITVAVDL